MKLFFLTSILSCCFTFCQANFVSTDELESEEVLGMGILSRLPGLWNGPVMSNTPAGSFPTWYVDFRPVLPGQISQYSSLDAETINYLSFFIVKHENKLKVAIRTEGVFQNKGCVTYEVIDSVNENEGYYRFSDFQSGVRRAYTEFKFTGEDSFVMDVYTTRFNTVSPLDLHSKWEAKCFDRTSAQKPIEYFEFPQAVMVKDFSDVFSGMFESIYYTFENDPYNSSYQPFVGTVNCQIEIDTKIKTKSTDELCIMLTTESIYQDGKYKPERLQYLSRIVYLAVGTKSITLKNIHPGNYYVYSFIDTNGDKKHTSGEYMSSNLENIIYVLPESHTVTTTTIDFVIP